MAEGLTPDLCRAALFAWIVVFAATSRFLRVDKAAVAATIKSGFTLAYFALIYDKSWTFFDDWAYLNNSSQVLAAGYTPWTAIGSLEGQVQLFVVSGGKHILYNWWNVLAQYYFGRHYYSAVFLNTGLTCIAAIMLHNLAQEAGFSLRYCRMLATFFIFHWDVMVWSSFTNLKDILVMTLTVSTVLAITRLTKRFSWAELARLAFGVFCFTWLRFYVPVILAAAMAAWMFFNLRGRGRVIAMAAAPIMVLPVVILRGTSDLEGRSLNPLKLVFGMFRMTLTPQPWSLDPAYSFLMFPAIIHWFLYLPTLVGGYLLARSSKATHYMLWYLFADITLYGWVEDIQGPRQRIQLLFIVAWLQFHAIWSFTGWIFRKRGLTENGFREAVA